MFSWILCTLGFHHYDTTNDPRCYRCLEFKNKEDPCYGNLFTRETRNGVARQIQARRELGIMDPDHDD